MHTGNLGAVFMCIHAYVLQGWAGVAPLRLVGGEGVGRSGGILVFDRMRRAAGGKEDGPEAGLLVSGRL